MGEIDLARDVGGRNITRKQSIHRTWYGVQTPRHLIESRIGLYLPSNQSERRALLALRLFPPRFMMPALYDRRIANPFLLPEIVGLVVDNVHMVADLWSCACVNSTWNIAALKRLYKGSLNDMQFRTPDIGSLNCLFVASRERFARNMGFVKHLLLSPESPAIQELVMQRTTRLICTEKCRAMRHRQSAELLLRPQGESLASLIIPFEIEGQDWSLISDLLLTRTVEFLAIDGYYCKLLMASQKLITPSVSLTCSTALPFSINHILPQ
jgi:hypothetical protein